MTNPLPSAGFSRKVFLSLSLHAIVAAGFWKMNVTPPVQASFSDSLVISSGMQAAMAGAAASQAVSEILPTPEPKKKTPVEDDEAEELKEEEQSIEERPPEKMVEKEPPSKNKQEKEKEKEKVEEEKTEPKPEPEPEPKVQQPASIESDSGHQGVNGFRDTEPDEKDTGLSQVAGGSEQQVFDASVRRHLLAKKITPRTLRRKRQSGTVTVEFTINRKGMLLEQRIARSSRVRAFNRAALNLVERAEPYPEAPGSVEWNQRQYTIKISYKID